MKRNKGSIKQIVDRYWPTAPKHEMEAAGDRVLNRLRAELKEHDTSLRSLYGDGWTAPPLDQREFQLLTAVSLLGDRGTGPRIAEMIEDWGGRIMIGLVYLGLDRLEDRGLIRRRSLDPGKPADERQYRFRVREAGERALARARAEGKQLVNAREDHVKGPCTETPR